MFKGQMPQVSADGVGITSGLEEEQAMASTEALGGIASGVETLFQNIDGAENPKEIMDAIRGDEATVEERKTELAQLVGKDDAFKTPESVLTMVQPLMTIIQSSGGISDLDTETDETATDETAMVAEGEGIASNIDEGNQMEALSRMMNNEPTTMLYDGTSPGGNPTISGLQAMQKMYTSPLGVLSLAEKLAPKVPKLADFTKQYVDKPSAYEEYAKIAPWQLVSEFGRALGTTAGKNPFDAIMKASMDPRVQKATDPLMQLRLLQAKEKTDRESKAVDKFVEAKKDAEAQRTKLYTSILPTLAGKENKFQEMKDGTVLKIDTSGNASVFKQGTAPTRIVGSSLLQYNANDKTWGVAHTTPGSNIKLYTGADGNQYAIDYGNPKKDGSHHITLLSGSKSEADKLSENLMFINTGDGGGFTIDKRNPTIERDDGTTGPNILFDIKGRDKTSSQSTDAGVLIVNESNPEKSFIIPGTEKEGWEKIGSDRMGFALYNKYDGSIKDIPGMKPIGPEWQEKMNEFVRASRVVNNPSKYGKLTLQAEQIKYNILANELMPKDDEFTKLVNREAENFRNKLIKSSGIDGGSIDIDNKVEQFKSTLNMARLKKMTTSSSMFDHQKDLKNVYATMLKDLVQDTNKRVRDSQALSTKAKLMKEISKHTRTGATAPFRLGVAKILEDFGIADKVISALDISREDYNSWIGGTIGSLEMASKIGDQFAVEFASSFPGNLNQSEVDLIKNAGLNLSTTREGIALMEKIFDAAALRDKQEQKIINDYMKNPENINKTVMEQHSEIQGLIMKNTEDNPIVSPEMIQAISGKDPKNTEFVFTIAGGDQKQQFDWNTDRDRRWNIVHGSGATTPEEFLTKGSAAAQAYAVEKYGANASWKDSQLKALFNRYYPLQKITNPRFKSSGAK